MEWIQIFNMQNFAVYIFMHFGVINKFEYTVVVIQRYKFIFHQNGTKMKNINEKIVNITLETIHLEFGTDQNMYPMIIVNNITNIL